MIRLMSPLAYNKVRWTGIAELGGHSCICRFKSVTSNFSFDFITALSAVSLVDFLHKLDELIINQGSD